MPAVNTFSTFTSRPLETTCLGRPFIALDLVNSTNSFALGWDADGGVVVAEEQTAGRGRLGRAWASAPEQGLWFTVCLDGLIEGLVFGAALAVRDAIGERPEVRIKWPNDVLINKKKVCGILIEHREGRTALGIGVNIHHRPEAFPPELRAKASSVEYELGGVWDRAAFLRELLTHLDRTVMLLRSGGYDAIRRRWAEACDLVGRRIRVNDLRGRVLEIDSSGALLLDTTEGERWIVSGDISMEGGT